MPAPFRPLTPAQPARLAAAALTFIVWALLTASVLWWWLRAGSGAAAPEAPVAGRASIDLDSTAVARALGSTGAATAPQATEEKKDTDANDARFALRGVLTHGQDGTALIAVSGKVRPVRVGAPVGDDAKGWTLREALPHAAVLAGDGRQVRLDMPGDEERTRIFKERAARTPQAIAPAPAPKLAPAPEPRVQPASRARWRRFVQDGEPPDEPQEEQ